LVSRAHAEEKQKVGARLEWVNLQISAPQGTISWKFKHPFFQKVNYFWILPKNLEKPKLLSLGKDLQIIGTQTRSFFVLSYLPKC
jgi:hypothetical protein